MVVILDIEAQLQMERKEVKARDWWEDAVQPCLFYGKVDFGDTVVSADSRISPTAKIHYWGGSWQIISM
jgi:hypothetical protein